MNTPESNTTDSHRSYPIAPESDDTRISTRFDVADALANAGFGDVFVLSHEAADRAFTPKRRELIAVLTTDDVGSQRELAERVDRNPGDVKRDLDILIEENIVGLEDNGRAYKPILKHDTIIVEPIVTPERTRDSTSR